MKIKLNIYGERSSLILSHKSREFYGFFEDVTFEFVGFERKENVCKFLRSLSIVEKFQYTQGQI